MSDAQLFFEIAALPEKRKEEVADFVGFLKHKDQQQNPKRERVYGYAKGFSKWLTILMSRWKTLKNICDGLFIRYPRVYLVY